MMTRPHPLRTTLTVFFGAVALYLALALLAIVRAHAGPADALHDPLTAAPLDTWADLARAKSAGGWALALVAGLVMLARAATRIPGAIGMWLGTGRRATIVAGVAAVAVAAYDVLAAGGTWAAVLLAVIGAALAAMHPAAPAPRGVSDPATTAKIIGGAAGLLAVAVGVSSLTSCAAVDRAGAAAKGAAIDCGKVEMRPVLELLGELGVQAALSAMHLGQVDVDGLEAVAIARGLEVGGCAAREFAARWAAGASPARGLLAQADPGAELVARLHARYGVTWTGGANVR